MFYWFYSKPSAGFEAFRYCMAVLCLDISGTLYKFFFQQYYSKDVYDLCDCFYFHRGLWHFKNTV